MNECKIKKIKENIQSKNEMIKNQHRKRFKYDYNFDDIFIFINLIPDDIIALIGTFINSKEIIAVERINKIYKKQYDIVNRSTDVWIKHLKQYPFLYSIKSIEEYTNKNISKIRIEKLTMEELNQMKELIYCEDRVFNHKDIIVDKDKFMILMYKDDWALNMHTIPERFISRIINYSKPTPRYLGQTYVDMRDYVYVVRYTNDFDCISYFVNRSYWPGEGMKGCFRHVFIWEHAFTHSMNIKLNAI